VHCHRNSNWNFLLQAFIGNNVDPYEYLDLYLTEKDLAETKEFTHQSAEQVDFIISKVDQYNVCIGELRRQVYRLFKVPGYTDQVSGAR
jgi:hypothetical protein